MDIDLSFCTSFGYPRRVHDHWEQVCRATLESLDCVESIIVLGSTSRGDLTYENSPETFRLYSDYEYLVMTEDRPRDNTVRDLRDRLNQLEAQWDIPGPIFDISVTINTSRQLKIKKYLDRTLFPFDFGASGKAVFGTDPTKKFADLSIKQADVGYFNSLAIIRLWNQLYLTPRNVVTKNPTSLECRIFKYTLARNSLELATILAPRIKKFGKGFKDRVDNLSITDTTEWIPVQYHAFLSDCLKLKRSPKSSSQTEMIHKGFLRGYLQFTQYLYSLEVGLEDLTLQEFVDRILSARGNPFRGGLLPMKRRLSRDLSYISSSMQNRTSPRSLLSWLPLARRIRKLVALIVVLHGWLFASIHGDSVLYESSDSTISTAKRVFHDLYHDIDPCCGTYRPEETLSWHQARKMTSLACAAWFAPTAHDELVKKLNWTDVNR